MANLYHLCPLYRNVTSARVTPLLYWTKAMIPFSKAGTSFLLHRLRRRGKEAPQASLPRTPPRGLAGPLEPLPMLNSIHYENGVGLHFSATDCYA